MRDPCGRILGRLREVGFKTHSGSLAPFDQPLPLAAGAAWDPRTVQLALVVEWEESQEKDAWQQLLFAAAGLRHHLSAKGPAAFGPPLVLAVVDDPGERSLRDLVEDLSESYAVFNRVDLNLVRKAEIESDEGLDDALAPLLPRCRAALGRKEAISKEDVQHFWAVLRERIEEAAEGLDDMFSGFRKVAGELAGERLTAGLDEAADLGAPGPVEELSLKEFRSFKSDEATLSPVTVVHGANGSGKSTLLEALEVHWAGTSQRRPVDVDAPEYGRHLSREGGDAFEIVVDGEAATGVAERPRMELVRCVLTQDSISSLVNSPPSERYERLISITGLELPEVGERTEALLREWKQEADKALTEAGMAPLKTAGSAGQGHIAKQLMGELSTSAPDSAELVAIEELLVKASGGAYSRRDWKGDSDAARRATEAVDRLLVRLPVDRDPELAEALDRAGEAVRTAAGARRDAAQALRLLSEGILEAEGAVEEPPEQADDAPPEQVPGEIAGRWLGHGRALRENAKRFHEDAKRIEADAWAERLRDYADALDSVADTVPERELERLAGFKASVVPPREPVEVPEGLWRAAGFSRPVEEPTPLREPIERLVELLQRQTAELDSLASTLQNHPARFFPEHSERVLGAVCRFELMRSLRRKSGPISQASGEVVADLLQKRLEPIVGELMEALVRFEWYFKRVKLVVENRELKIKGIAVPPDRDLDARLLLNSAERTVFGLAWFLALHLLQPPERRRVLVLDDASAAFDSANRAGFVSTLRAFLRLLRPEQAIVVSHDDAVAESLAEELAPVDGWPAALARLRCRRDAGDASTVVPEAIDEEPRSLEADLDHLGLEGRASVSA